VKWKKIAQELLKK